MPFCDLCKKENDNTFSYAYFTGSYAGWGTSLAGIGKHYSRLLPHKFLVCINCWLKHNIIPWILIIIICFTFTIFTYYPLMVRVRTILSILLVLNLIFIIFYHTRNTMKRMAIRNRKIMEPGSYRTFTIRQHRKLGLIK